MISKREILIKGKMYEVEDISKYVRNPDGYLNGYTAVDIGQQYILPIVPSNSNSPGIYIGKNNPILYAREPIPDDSEQYDRSNVIDYSKAKDLKEFAETQNMVRELEKDILTSPDNIFVPPQDENDSPAMKALKEATTKKHIDLDKYETRFGANYNNDKRLFNKSNISLPMLVRMCNALDIKASLTLEDQTSPYGDIPNPIGDVISVELTSNLDGNNTEE